MTISSTNFNSNDSKVTASLLTASISTDSLPIDSKPTRFYEEQFGEMFKEKKGNQDKHAKYKVDLTEFDRELTYRTDHFLNQIKQALNEDVLNCRKIAGLFTQLNADQIKALNTLQVDENHLEYLQSGKWVWAFLAQQTKIVDQLIKTFWCALIEQDECEISLFATGGYGRGELFPFSDIDLLILTGDEQHIQNQQISIGKFIQSLWDCGLQPSHQVVTLKQLDDLVKQDLPLATSLLETRFLAGNHNFIEDIQAINQLKNWSFERFFNAKLSEQTERHKSYLGTHYHLEPDIKNNLGGLRELHLLRWLAIKLTLSDQSQVFISTLDSSAQRKVFATIFKPNERQALFECMTQLNAFRFALHLCLKRKDERLLFQHQISVANLLGYREVSAEQAASLQEQTEQISREDVKANVKTNVKVNVEAMMKIFYLTNQQVIELNQLAILLFAKFAQISLPVLSVSTALVSATSISTSSFATTAVSTLPVSFSRQHCADVKQKASTEQSNSFGTSFTINNINNIHQTLQAFSDGEFELIVDSNDSNEGMPKLKLITGYDFDALRVLTFFYLLAELRLPIEAVELETFRQLREVRETVFQPILDVHESISHSPYLPKIREMFMRILMHDNAMMGLLPMHRLGFLWRYDPSWLLIQGLMQFDRFHAYTVDEHTFQVMIQLETIKKCALTSDSKSGKFPESVSNIMVQVWKSITQVERLPKLLLIAGLFHDLGKGRGGNHAEIGGQLAINFFAQYPIETDEVDLVIWLVRHHLDFSITAQRRDISDINVIKTFAKLVENVQRLQLLFLLTVADIKGTHPTLWNSWKQTLLEQLYHKTLLFLKRKKHFNADWREQIRTNKHNAKCLLLESGYLVASMDQNRLTRFWQRCRVDYFLSHSPAQLSWHAGELLDLADNQPKQQSQDQSQHSDKTLIDSLRYMISAPKVLLSNQFEHGGSELFIWADDRKNLFAYVVELIDCANLSILAANIFTNRDNMAMDSFIVTERLGKKLDEQRQFGLIATLQSALNIANFENGYPLSQIQKKQKSESVFSLQSQIKFLPSQHPNRSYLEIIALDRKGLLVKIAHTIALQNLVILGAKITTVGERAEDMFILVDQDRNALTIDQQTLLIRELEGWL